MEKEYIEYTNEDLEIKKEKIIKKDKLFIEKFKKECSENIEKVIIKVNDILSQNEYSSISDFWSKKMYNDFGSYSFVKSVFSQYGYYYFSNEKTFRKDLNQINSNNNVEELSKEFKLEKREKNTLSIRSFRIEEGILKRLDSFCDEQPFYSKGYIISQLLDESLKNTKRIYKE